MHSTALDTALQFRLFVEDNGLFRCRSVTYMPVLPCHVVWRAGRRSDSLRAISRPQESHETPSRVL